MSVKSATEFLMDLKNHADAPSRAMEASLESLEELAAELGHEDVSGEDILAAVSDMGGDTDEVEGFALSSKSLLGGLDFGGVSLGGATLGAKGQSSSTHGPERRKWPKPGCDCDND